MERFHELLENHHQYARDWKARTGGKVIGYLCPYLPEELPYAAGVLPVRLLAKHEPDDLSERYLPSGTCPPARNIFLQLMKGRYDYLDGVGCGEGCQWLRHTFTSWEFHGNTSYHRHVFVPVYPQGHRAKTLLRGELELFKDSLEVWTGKKITNEALDHAIDVYNTNRRLMKQVYEMRRAENPPISGAEAMEMMLASQVMDKEEHNRLLAEVLSNFPEWRDGGSTRVRLMLIGSETYDAELEKLTESLGGDDVTDELCNGSSYFWNEVVPQKDRLMAIALRYLDKHHCAIKDNRYRRRQTRILQLAEDYNVQGAILLLQRYCVPHSYDTPFVQDALRERGIPFHAMELLDTTMPTAETKIRLEAFMDMLRSRPAAELVTPTA